MATTCVSLQLTTWPAVLPSKTAPVPCEDPKPVPVIVTEVSGAPETGLTLVMRSVVHGKWNRIAPDAVPQNARVAGSRSRGHLSDNLRIVPAFYHATRAAKPHLAAALGRTETGARDGHLGPATPLAAVTPEMAAVVTLNETALDDTPPCCTRAVPDVELEATVATIAVSLQLTTVP